MDSVQLHQMLLNMSLPSQWIILSADPISICKITVCTGKPAKAFATISIGKELEWLTLSGLNCPMLAELPSKIENVAVVQI